jgi:hypothetical protein
MTEVVDQLPPALRDVETPPSPLLPRSRSAERGLTEAVWEVLEASPEPLTPAKIRAQLPAALRRIASDTLAEALHRQVEAGVLYAYCPYRSQQPRFWHRPPPDHLARLIRDVLAAGPLTWSQLLRKLPEYATTRAEEVLDAQLAQGMVYLHPGVGPRGGPRYGLLRPDPRPPLRRELTGLFQRLRQRLGFSEDQLRAAALELLQDEEWGCPQEPTSREPRYQE